MIFDKPSPSPPLACREGGPAGPGAGVVFGGYIQNGSAGAENNEVIIGGSNGTYGSIVGGCTNGGAAMNNTITIESTAANVTITSLSGGERASTGDIFSGNTLIKNSAGATVTSAQNLETFEFGYSGDANITTLDTTPNSVSGLVELDTQGNDIDFNGIITGATGGIDKRGAGMLTLSAANIKGDTGLLEVGLTLRPTPNSPFSVDFGLQGYNGKREGVTGSLRVDYRF
jgi:hypothetical protein